VTGGVRPLRGGIRHPISTGRRGGRGVGAHGGRGGACRRVIGGGACGCRRARRRQPSRKRKRGFSNLR
jgi:hypothetical protein